MEWVLDTAMLDLGPFTNAVANLDGALKVYSRLAPLGEDLRRTARDSAIQRFEYTYELAVRFLRKQLETMDSETEVDRLGYRDLIRLGAERGFIDDPEAWFEFRDQRNLTVHTYNQINAEEVFSSLPPFRVSARFLLARLQERQ